MDTLIGWLINVLVVTAGAVFVALGLGMLHVPVAFVPRLLGSDLVLWGICIASLINGDHR